MRHFYNLCDSEIEGEQQQQSGTPTLQNCVFALLPPILPREKLAANELRKIKYKSRCSLKTLRATR